MKSFCIFRNPIWQPSELLSMWLFKDPASELGAQSPSPKAFWGLSLWWMTGIFFYCARRRGPSLRPQSNLRRLQECFFSLESLVSATLRKNHGFRGTAGLIWEREQLLRGKSPRVTERLLWDDSITAQTILRLLLFKVPGTDPMITFY